MKNKEQQAPFELFALLFLNISFSEGEAKSAELKINQP